MLLRVVLDQQHLLYVQAFWQIINQYKTMNIIKLSHSLKCTAWRLTEKVQDKGSSTQVRNAVCVL